MPRWTEVRKLRILDFDIENRPLSYRGQFPTADITAIAASFEGAQTVHCWLLGDDEPETMLRGFVELYDQADIVTGHYIRKHDLPIINGALMEFGLPTLRPKMTSDTWLDLAKRKDLPTSQEDLSEMFGLAAPKVHMSQTKWRRANRLDQIELTGVRVVGDVKQHKQLRAALIERGLLGPPKLWRSK